MKEKKQLVFMNLKKIILYIIKKHLLINKVNSFLRRT